MGGKWIAILIGGVAVAMACGEVTVNADAAGTGGPDSADVDAVDSAVDGTHSLRIVTSQLPAGNLEVPYDVSLEAEGGVPPYSWLADELPSGLSASSSGEITGIPEDEGDYEVGLTVTDDDGVTATISLELVINDHPTIITDSFPALHVLRSFELTVEVGGGAPPYTFGASGLLPGLVIDAETGIIANDPGAPAIIAPAETTVSIVVTDAQGETDTLTARLSIIAIAAIAAGGFHTCALDEEGAAFCWGSNSSGQLGDGTTISSSVPVPVLDGDGQAHRFAKITAGNSHTCGLDEEGVVFCWGNNDSGRLGDGSTIRSSRPVRVVVGDGLNNAAAIAAGAEHTCAFDEEGAAFCWGNNGSGRLGSGTSDEFSSSPVRVAAGAGLNNAATITAAANHTCAIDQEGAAFCWGSNTFGRLGNGSTDQSFSSPVRVALGDGLDIAAAVSARGDHTCVVDEASAAFCWGLNDFSQLGDGSTDEFSRSPVRVAFGDGLNTVAIAAGSAHSCVVSEDGAARCWGANNAGQVGDASNENRSAPSPVHPGELNRRFD